MRYQILGACTHHELTEVVEKWLVYGWKPQGGVVLTTDNHDIPYFVQAVIHEKESPVFPR